MMAASATRGVRELEHLDLLAPDGERVRAWQLWSEGLRVEIMSWGCYISKIDAPDKSGKWADVVLGFDFPDDFDGYKTPAIYGGRTHWFGSMIGRYCGRIAGGRFGANGTVYDLAKNLGDNHLHGGQKGWDQHSWSQVDPCSIATEGMDTPSLTLARTSPHGEEGYPASLNVMVRFSICEGSALKIEYSVRNADEERSTVVNLTNHSYFNLAGDCERSVYDHTLQLNACRFCAVDAAGLPLKELQPVAGTPFDFTSPARLGDRIAEEHEQLTRGFGYDHSFVLPPGRARREDDGETGEAGEARPLQKRRRSGEAPRTLGGKAAASGKLGFAGIAAQLQVPWPLQWAASLSEPTSRRLLEVFTTEPAVHVYSGNHVPFTAKAAGKAGKKFSWRSGVCLETQHLPDSPNRPEFPSTLLGPGECYTSCTAYCFGVAEAEDCLPALHGTASLNRPDL